MPSAELFFRLANVVLAASALGIAALIIRAIHHRASRRVEPLGVVFALVFLGIGLRAAVRVWATPWTLPEGAAATLIAVDWLAAGRVELNPRPTHVRHVADQVITVVTVAAQAKQIRIENAVPPDLPLVQADPSRLQQILVNLVGNGVKFSSSAGLVRVTAGRQREQVWVAVEDRGVGIPKDELARIWDPFYQVEAPMQRRHGGSGLGLAIVRRLVELHGGVVRAESEGENRGSRFSFTLPVSTVAPRSAVAVEETESRVEPVLAGREVLIVDDDLPNQDLMRTGGAGLLGG